MEVTYKSRNIHIVPELHLETVTGFETLMCLGSVAPNAITAYRPTGYFKIIDQAEIYAVEMAKTWIDAESADDLTP